MPPPNLRVWYGRELNPSNGEVDKRPWGSPTGDTPVLKSKENWVSEAIPVVKAQRLLIMRMPKLPRLMPVASTAYRAWSKWDVLISLFLSIIYQYFMEFSDIPPDEVENLATPDEKSSIWSNMGCQCTTWLTIWLKTMQYLKGVWTVEHYLALGENPSNTSSRWERVQVSKHKNANGIAPTLCE